LLIRERKTRNCRRHGIYSKFGEEQGEGSALPVEEEAQKRKESRISGRLMLCLAVATGKISIQGPCNARKLNRGVKVVTLQIEEVGRQEKGGLIRLRVASVCPLRVEMNFGRGGLLRAG